MKQGAGPAVKQIQNLIFLSGCMYMLCSQQTHTCLGNSSRETHTTCTHISETGGEAHKVNLWKGKIKLERQQNAPGLKWEIYVGNGTVLRKNRKINCCLAAAEDMDHLARAGRKYPKNSNSASKELKETGYCMSYSSQGRAASALVCRGQTCWTRLDRD